MKAHKKWNRTQLVVLSILLIASLLLAACGGGSQPAPATQQPAEKPAATQAAAQPPAAGGQQVVRVWINWGDNPAQLQELFDKFGAANNVKVEVTAPVENDKILPALTSSEPPDVLILSGGDLVKSYAAEGLVDELSGAIQAGGIDLNDFFAAPLAQCKQGDKLYCLPWGSDLYALLWNKDLFEAAGLDPEKPPKTMEELVQFNEKLTKVGADGAIEQIGFIPDQSWSHNDLYTALFGGFWYNQDGTKLTANSQPVIDSQKWQQQFYSKYGYDKVLGFSSGFGEYSSPDNPFYAGKLAMITEGEWQTGPNFIANYKPELNYGVAAFPPPADHPERAGTAVAQGSTAVIPSRAPDKAMSAKLLAWIMSPQVVADEMVTNANLPTSKKAAQDPRFNSNPKFKVFLDLMNNPNVKTLITTPISLELNDAMAAAEEKVLHTGADPQPLFDAIQAEFAPKLEAALQSMK